MSKISLVCSSGCDLNLNSLRCRLFWYRLAGSFQIGYVHGDRFRALAIASSRYRLRYYIQVMRYSNIAAFLKSGVIRIVYLRLLIGHAITRWRLGSRGLINILQQSHIAWGVKRTWLFSNDGRTRRSFSYLLGIRGISYGSSAMRWISFNRSWLKSFHPRGVLLVLLIMIHQWFH